MTSTTTSLARTPFHKFHVNHGAKMVEFAGWEMPLHYGSIIDEHHQVRNSGGMFDVSHMGRLRFTGRDACAFLDRVCTRQIHGMSDGQVRYSLICNERGGCKDDVLVYKRADADYLMVCNAANREKVLRHFDAVKSQTRRSGGEFVFKLSDQTDKTAMVAIQGPNVIKVMSDFTRAVTDLKRYRFVEKSVLVAKVMISRTGYTGEDGVEVICRR
jgi:aminomethyltransferase